MRGELSDEEDKEKYCVDFFRKGYEQDEPPQPQNHDVPQTLPPENEDGDNDPSALFNTKPVVPGRTAGAVDNVEHKRFIRYGINVFQVMNLARSFLIYLEIVTIEQYLFCHLSF